MEICLIRHGKPQFWDRYEPHTVISGDQVENAVLDYYNSGIQKSSFPPQYSIKAAQSAAVAFCSGLKRTVETAAALGLSCSLISNPLFRETEVPFGFWKRLKMPLIVWFVISRTGWLLGLPFKGETVELARLRAEQAASFLIKAAQVNGKVLLVGHGFMNSMIFRALQKKKWKSSRPFNGKFWGCNVLVYKD